MTTPVGTTTSTAKGGALTDGDGIGGSKDRGRLIAATHKANLAGSAGRASQTLSRIMTLDNLVTIGRTVIKVAPK
jgi:hypothetical protein